jgi:hypothetical protein
MLANNGRGWEGAELSIVADCVGDTVAPDVNVAVDFELFPVVGGAAVGVMVVDFNPTPPGPNDTLSLAIVVVT